MGQWRVGGKRKKENETDGYNSQEPEELVSKFWSHFRVCYAENDNDSEHILAWCWPGKELQKQRWSAPPTGEGLASPAPKLTLIWRRGPARHSLQRRGFAIRHVGWSFSSGLETGVTSWAPRQLHSCSGEPLSLGLQRLRPTGAGLGWTRVGPRLECLLSSKG